jgi:thioester reductase-like protein
MRLARRLEKSGATALQATPATWRLLLESGWNGAGRARLFSAGEALPREVAERLLPLAREVWNFYGPTETTVFSTIHPVASGTATVPLGHPIANTRVYVVDPRFVPVPVGIAGELLIGGLGVARGYLGRPELTAERFVPDPFGAGPGDRLYRTGDLARRRADGNLEFLGRLDHQLKVRGFRIEPAEVEAALVRHPALRQAVVVAVPGLAGDARLMACLVAAGERMPPAAELRAFLARSLPESMIPTSYVSLQALPLTPNGKIDRKALSEGAAARGGGLERPAYVAPRTPEEEILARIWSDLLAVERVGIDDDFFDLGGHSLLVAQLVARVRETLAVEIPLGAVLESPTIGALARLLPGANGAAGVAAVTSEAEPDLAAEAVLAPEIRPAPDAVTAASAFNVAAPRSVFLTGASGFIGSFLLHELLVRTAADVHCLVRATDERTAAARLRRRLAEADLWEEGFASRIVPVVGDLAEPRFGLSAERFDALAATVEAIYHNGAWVNFLYPYSALKPANVLGTEEALRLAVQRSLKPLHYVSTTSVLEGGDTADAADAGPFHEDATGSGRGLKSGYAQSKWVAERLVENARSRGVPTSIYRLGRVTGHSLTAVSNGDDFLFLLMKSCLELGSAPDLDLLTDMTPVDFVARAIVHLSLRPESSGKNFHLVNPDLVPWSRLVDGMRSFGYSLHSLPAEAWYAALAEAATREGGELASILPLLGSAVAPNGGEGGNGRQGRVGPLRLDSSNSFAGLAGSAISCPAVDERLATAYLSYFIRTGQLTPPPGIPVGVEGE